MKSSYLLMIAAFAFLAFAGFASADSAMVAGKIYNSDYSATVPNANVNVTCNNITISTVSLADGSYIVKFGEGECNEGSVVLVEAEKDGMTGNSNADVHDGSQIFADCNLDFAVANVALIPEFGLIMGFVTIAGALVAFFVIRRK